MINENKLQLYLENDLNILIEGRPGVGKTEQVKSLFNKMNLNWRYFSAATMDPWVDFIGVPKSVKREDGKEVLQLIKPEDFADDKIEALFFDEFNRAPEKVMNAVMELMQFKSINGVKMNNLKVVWAAINPYDEENTYSVNKMDQAILERFHIKLKAPYKLNKRYMLKTHGEDSVPFMSWWEKLPQKIKFEVSPRTLDYAIRVHSIGGDLSDVLPEECNIKSLEKLIADNNVDRHLQSLVKSSNEEIQKKMTLDNTQKWYKKIFENPEKYKKLIENIHPDFIENKMKTGSVEDKALFLKGISDKKIKNEMPQLITNTIKDNADTVHLPFTQDLINFIDNKHTSITRTFLKKMSSYHDIFKSDNNLQKIAKTDNFFEFLFTQLPDKSVEKIYDNLLNRVDSQITGYSNYYYFSRSQFLAPSNDKKAAFTNVFMGLTYRSAWQYRAYNTFYESALKKETVSFNKKLEKIFKRLNQISISNSSSSSHTVQEHFFYALFSNDLNKDLLTYKSQDIDTITKIIGDNIKSNRQNYIEVKKEIIPDYIGNSPKNKKITKKKQKRSP